MKELLGKHCQQAVFIIPDPESFPSGGNVYNRRLMNNIQKSGIQVSFVENQVKGKPSLLEQADTLFLDSLFLNSSYEWFWDEFQDKEKVIIFHHLDCLEKKSITSQKSCFSRYQSYFDKANSVLVTSAFSRQWLVSQGISEEKIIVIPPTITWEIKPQAAKRNKVCTGLMVANLIPRKGIFPFLASLNSQLTTEIPFQIQIAGSHKLEPSYALSCQHLVDKSPNLASRISFLKEIPPENMPLLYQQADVLISASMMETFGMALQEAQYFGLPILALGSEKDGGNIASFCLDDKKGKLYPDFRSLAQAFLDLSRNYDKEVDADLR